MYHQHYPRLPAKFMMQALASVLAAERLKTKRFAVFFGMVRVQPERCYLLPTGNMFTGIAVQPQTSEVSAN